MQKLKRKECAKGARAKSAYLRKSKTRTDTTKGNVLQPEATVNKRAKVLKRL